MQLIAKINAKWMREFMAYNPAEGLLRIQVPILGNTGSKDIQVDPRDLKQMAEIVQTDFDHYEVPNASQILRIEEGELSLSTYKKRARQPMDSRVLSLVSEWLRKYIPAQPKVRAQ